RSRLKISIVTCVTFESSMSTLTKFPRRCASSTTRLALQYASSGSRPRPNCVSLIETFERTFCSSIFASMFRYSVTSRSASIAFSTDSFRWSNEAVAFSRLISRIIGITSSTVSPATKRVVSFLNNLKPVAKSFNPSWRDNQISALLVVICGPSLLYPAFRDAIKACNSRFIARGDCGCRFLHRVGVGCLLREGFVQSRPAGGVYSPPARTGDYLRFNLCLPSHRTPPQTSGFSYCVTRYTAHAGFFCLRVNSKRALEQGRTSTTWATHRIVTITRRQHSIQSLFAPDAKHRSRNECVRRDRLLILRHLA